MSKLSYQARQNLSEGAFVFPKERRYPIHDEAHARNALARASGKAEEAKVRAAVHSKYPGIGKEAMAGFADELVKIGGIGTYAREIAAQAGRAVKRHTLKAGENVGKTISAFGSPKKAIKAGWNATFHPNGKPLSTPWKVLMGASLVSGGASAMKKEDPMGKGHSRLRRTTRLIGDQAGGLIGAPFGLAGGITGGVIGGKLGDMAGAGVDKIRRFKPRPQVAMQHPQNLPPRPTGLTEGA